MSDPLAQQAGSALLWRGVQLAGVKAIFLARTIVVARLLSPEHFGLLAISMVAVDFLMSITNFGVIPALVQRKDADERWYHAAWTLNLVRALAITVAVFLAAPFIAALFLEPRATDLIRVIALRPLLEALASIKMAELTRRLRFRSLSLIGLSDALVNTAVAIALAPILGAWALIAGILAGQGAYVVTSYAMAPYRPRLSFDRSISRSLVRYGRWIFLTGLIAAVASSTLQAIVSRQLGVVELGLLFLAMRLALIPAEIASEVFGAVTFPLYARLQTNAQQAARAFRSILIGMMALLIPVSVLIMALAPSLVQNVLGARWEGTETLIRVLVFVNIIGLLGEAVVPIFKGMGKPQKITVLEGIQSLLLISLVLSLTAHYGVVGAALAWLPAIFASQVVAVVLLRQILPRPLAGLGMPVLLIAGASALGGLVALGVDNTVPGLVGLMTGGLLGTVTVGGLLWICQRRVTPTLAADLIRAYPRASALLRPMRGGGSPDS